MYKCHFPLISLKKFPFISRLLIIALITLSYTSLSLAEEDGDWEPNYSEEVDPEVLAQVVKDMEQKRQTWMRDPYYPKNDIALSAVQVKAAQCRLIVCGVTSFYYANPTKCSFSYELAKKKVFGDSFADLMKFLEPFKASEDAKRIELAKKYCTEEDFQAEAWVDYI